MLIPQYLVLVLKLTPINTVSLNRVFLIPQNQCYPGNTCTLIVNYSLKLCKGQPDQHYDYDVTKD